MGVRNLRRLGVVLMFAVTSVATPARADFNLAVAAYDRGDFAAAADQFERLARIGNPRAQYNFGLMLVQGQGRPRDLQAAYSWLEAARGNGDTAGEPVLAQLRERKALDPAIAARHAERYAALPAEQLRPPKLFAAAESQSDAAALRPIEVVFPDRAATRGQLGVVWTLLLVGEDGISADGWPVFSVPREEFDDVLEDAFKRGRFAPATLDGRPVPSTSATRFRFGYLASVSGDLTRHPPATQWVAERRAKAEAGDIASQALLGIVLSAYPELGRDADESSRWLESGSRGGAVDATFLLGFTRAMNARNAAAWQQGMSYLMRAGIAGHAQAQLLVALELARDPDEPVQARALDWLAAAAPAEPRAALYLSAELMLSPHESLRDLSRARRVLQPLIAAGSERRNPLLWEVAAALSAMDGRLPEAVERQTRAVRLRGEAPGRGNSLSQQRLRAYAAGRLWTERLTPVSQRYSATDLSATRGCAENAEVGSRIPRCN
jgi:TPR repeat protein